MEKAGFARAVARALVIASLPLAGCANLVEFTGKTQDTGILTPNTVQGERPPTFLERATGINDERNPELRGARRLRGGAKDEVRNYLQQPVDCAENSQDRYTFFCAQRAAESKPSDPDRAKSYLAAGLTLSNEVCSNWFNHLLVTQVSLRQSADMISTVGSLTAAILGFTQTPPEVTGLTASVFGTTKSAVDNLASNYIVATDLTTVSAALREYRGLYAREIDASPTVWNYYTARRVIMAYDNTCSALFVRKFVNARVSGAKGDNETNPLLESAISGFADDGDKYFDKKITPAQLVDIYAVTIMNDTPQPVRDVLVKGLEKEQLINADGTVKFKAGVESKDFAAALVRANIDVALRTRATLRVDTIRQQLAGAVKDKEALIEAKQAIALTEEGAYQKLNATFLDKQRLENEAIGQRESVAKPAAAQAQTRVDKAETAIANLAADASPEDVEKAKSERTEARAALTTANIDLGKAEANVATAHAATEAARIEATAAKGKRDKANDDVTLARNDRAAAEETAGGVSQSGSVSALRDITPLGATGRPLDTPPAP